MLRFVILQRRCGRAITARVPLKESRQTTELPRLKGGGKLFMMWAFMLYGVQKERAQIVRGRDNIFICGGQWPFNFVNSSISPLEMSLCGV